MKNMKKIVSIVLALAMMLCLNIVVFAADGGEDPVTPPTYTDQKTVTIKKIYKLENAGTTSPAEIFTVEQVGSGRVTDGDADSVPDLGPIVGAEYGKGDATVDGTERDITITLPTYDTVGVYEYTLQETVGTTAGVIYHTGDIKLVVTVMQGDDGKIRVAGVHTETAGGKKSGSIENKYQAAGIQENGTGLKITKTVSGNMADHEKYFEFNVTLTGVEGKTYNNPYTIMGGSDDRNPDTCTVGSSFKVYLKADETITIENLPYGVTYTVDETDYSDEKYTTTGEVLSPEEVDSATEEVTVNNEKKGDVDTGIYMDSLPYILLLAVVAVAGFVFISKKRYANN